MRSIRIFAGLASSILFVALVASASASQRIRPGDPPWLGRNQVLPRQHRLSPALPGEVMRAPPPSFLLRDDGMRPYGLPTAFASLVSPSQLYPGLSLEAGHQPDGVAAADLNGDGAADLVVTNTIGGNVSVLLGNGNGTFLAKTDYPTAGFTRSPVIADFNGDGKPDIATANDISRSVSVLLGDGKGAFQDAKADDLDAGVEQIAAADVNGDGKPDLLASDSASLFVLIGKGNGTFKGARTYSLAANEIATCDINGDGNPDVVALDSEDSLIKLRLGNGDGTFQPVASYSPGYYPTGVACADFNGDGNADVSVAGVIVDPQSGHRTPYMDTFLGQTDGTLTGPDPTPIAFPPGVTVGAPYEHAAGDFNGDGRPDLLVDFSNLEFDGDSIQIFLGNGDGTFSAGDSYFGESALEGFTLADLNGDDSLDLAIVNGIDDSVTPVFGNGNGTLQAGRISAVYGAPETLALGDLDDDGKLDIVTANQDTASVSVVLAGANGDFLPEQHYYIGGPNDYWLWGVTIADFDGDGNPDVATSVEGNDTVGILFGNGDGTLDDSQTYPVGSHPLGIAATDLNGDGAPDIVVANSYSSDVSILLNNGDGTFQSQTAYPTGAFPDAVAIADLNGDGYPDIAVTNYDGNSISVFLGNGDGTFQSQQVYPVGSNPWSIAVSDFNNDGNPDFAVTNSCTNTSGICAVSVGVLLGRGDGSFQDQQTYAAGDIPIGIAAADVNDDGNLDLAVTQVSVSTSPEYPADTIGIFIGNGDGTFQRELDYATGFGPSDVQSADMDGDGWPDLVVGDTLGGNVVVMPHLHPAPLLATTHFDAVSNELLDGQLAADDPFGQALNFALVSPAPDGEVSVTASGAFTYTSDSGFAGLDSFVVSVSDRRASSRTRVYVTVRPTGPGISAPAAMVIQQATGGGKTHGGPESFTVEGTGSLTVSAATDNAGLIPAGEVSVSPVTGSAGTRHVTVYPVSGKAGTAVVTLTVEDTYGQVASASFEVTVAAAPPKSSGGSGGVGGGGGGGGAISPWCLLMLLGVSVSIGLLRRRYGR